MIARIQGTIVESGEDYVVVDTGGVGYRVRVPKSTAVTLQREQDVILHTEMIVRQDAILLYGFQTGAELKVFRLLTSVSRVGPQLATAILSGLRADQVAGAVLAGDARLLATIPGVGKTGAERIILELKKKATGLVSEIRADVPAGGSAEEDAILGLISLGYSQNEAVSTVRKIDPSRHNGTAAGIIREALRFLKEKGDDPE